MRVTTGSIADIPKSLTAEIKSLEEQLTVGPEKLKAISDHFVKELEKGTCTLGLETCVWSYTD